jgi:hypothetical protein
MSIAESSRFQLRYLEETVWGTTPASALKNFRCTGASLKQVNQTTVSEEIRSDRQITDLVRVGVSATARVDFEVSYGALDDFLEGALAADWVAPTAAGTILVDDPTVVIGDTTVHFDGITTLPAVGDVFTVAGDTQHYTIISTSVLTVADADFTFYPAAKVAWADNAAVTVKDFTLRNGTTPKSYTLEGEFSNITQFLCIKGCRVSSLSLSMRVGSIVTGTMELTGKIATIGGATAGTGAAVAAPTADVFDVVNLNGVKEGGTAIELVAIELTINGGARAQQVLGTSGLKGVGLGRFNVTGSLEAYFEDASIMTDYLAHTASGLEWILQDAAGNLVAFAIDKLRWTDGETPVDGNDTDVMQRYPFQAIMHPTTLKTLRLTRDAA